MCLPGSGNEADSTPIWAPLSPRLQTVGPSPKFLTLKGVVNCQNSGDRDPQKAIVPVGRPRPYSIIILNMRLIPKASLRASSQITASSNILERHLWVNNSKPLAFAPTWSLACKQTDCITVGVWKLLDPKLVSQTLYIYSMWVNVGPASQTLA